jgi:anti-sigma B factor antagonist
MTLEFQATPDEVMRAVDALREFAGEQGLSDEAIFGLTLALEESGSNVVNHGLKRDAEKRFKITFQRQGSKITVELRDPGPPFNPLEVPADVPEADEDADAVGGWGIDLIRRYTDQLLYRRDRAENVLLLVKSFAEIGPHQVSKHEPNINSNTDMPLDIQILKGATTANASSATVKLTGSLDTSTAPELEKQLAPVVATQIKDITFDLADLKFVSSAGLRVFANTRKQLKERGGQASFVHLQTQIKEVFEIIKSLPGVAVFKDIAELDRYLAARQKSYESPA